MSVIDKLIPNQILVWETDYIIIAGYPKHDNKHMFIGNNIVPAKSHYSSWFKNKNEEWSYYHIRPLPILPPILTFKIHDDEKY